MKPDTRELVWSENRPDVSIVIPFLNEEQTLEPLFLSIESVLSGLGYRYEVIFVNDGSIDGSEAICSRIAERQQNVTLINFRRNFGKAAALSAGFKRAAGGIIITMDADLQDDPVELPRFLAEVRNGADVVCGWKQVRKDPLGKTLPSKLFNTVVNRSFGLKLRDHNCGFKAYRAEAIGSVNLYGELHRFVPALLEARGYRIVEIAVNHRPRVHGVSKYGVERFIKGALDLLTVALTTRYGARPLHMFGGGGIFLSLLGGALLSYLAIVWLVGGGPIGDRPLLLFGMLLLISGIQMVGVGLLGELFLARSIREADKYDVRNIVESRHVREALRRPIIAEHGLPL